MSENSGGTPSFEIAGQMKTCVDHGCHIQVPVKKICMLNGNMFENLSGMLEVNTKQNREHSTARPPGQFEEENLKNVQKRRKRQISACLPTCCEIAGPRAGKFFLTPCGKLKSNIWTTPKGGRLFF